MNQFTQPFNIYFNQTLKDSLGYKETYDIIPSDTENKIVLEPEFSGGKHSLIRKFGQDKKLKKGVELSLLNGMIRNDPLIYSLQINYDIINITIDYFYKNNGISLYDLNEIAVYSNICHYCNKCKNQEEKRIMALKQFGNNKISSNTCFKRYLLFFRWMVGKPPDLNQWTFIPANQLLIPLDVHLQRIMSRIGIIEKEKPCKWKDVIKISMFLNKVDPIDPIYYDLAISRLGILEICKKELQKSKCKICPLRKSCIIQKKSVKL